MHRPPDTLDHKLGKFITHPRCVRQLYYGKRIGITLQEYTVRFLFRCNSVALCSRSACIATAMLSVLLAPRLDRTPRRPPRSGLSRQQIQRDERPVADAGRPAPAQGGQMAGGTSAEMGSVW